MMPLKRRLLLLLSSLLVAIASLQGCGFIPKALDPLLATRSGKYRMLGESVQKFHKALNWGEPSAATEFVKPESYSRYVSDVFGPGTGHRITDVRVDEIDFPPTEEETAYVYSTVRYYGPPSIQVRAYSTKQTWTYSRMDGCWFFEKAEKSQTRNSDPGALGGFIR